MALRILLRLPLPSGIAAQLAARAAQNAAFVELVNARLDAEVARAREAARPRPLTPVPPTGNA